MIILLVTTRTVIAWTNVLAALVGSQCSCIASIFFSHTFSMLQSLDQLGCSDLENVYFTVVAPTDRIFVELCKNPLPDEIFGSGD
jgi:hypothetical protein